MTTVHQLMSWIKEKSKRSHQSKMAEKTSNMTSDTTHVPEQAQRGSVCRASMKLPPIPREERRKQIALSRPHTNSPAHIYEEIPYATMQGLKVTQLKEGNTDISENTASPPQNPDISQIDNVKREQQRSDNVDITNLDFDQAKEFGSFLVVPIRGKQSAGHGQGQGHIDGQTRLEQAPRSESLDSSGICDTSLTSYGSQTSRGECYSCGDVSSSDSGFHSGHSADMRRLSIALRNAVPPGEKTRLSIASHDSGHGDESTGDHLHGDKHVHCRKCSRPHGIYHGVLMSGEHDGQTEELNFDVYTLENLDIQDENCASKVDVPLQKMPGHRLGQPGSAFAALHNKNIKHGIPAKRNGIITCLRTKPSRDRSHQSCDKVSPRSISESDSGASSVYAYSGSDKDLLAKSRERLRYHESDSSNDTFSEYDMRSGEVTPSSGDHYDYFLSKVKHNLSLKQDVQRIILSESSEYDTSEYQDYQEDRLDSVSLTTVTSLSDISTIDLDDAKSEKSSKSDNTDNNEHKVKRKTKKECRCHSSESDRPRKSKDSEKHSRTKNMKSVHSRTEIRKNMKKKSAPHSSSKDMEFYNIPDFPRSALDLTTKEASEFDALERLSCRATDYKPNESTSSLTGSAPVSPVPVPSPVMKNKVPPRKQHDHNRLLGDLMKMNHDRQLLVLF